MRPRITDCLRDLGLISTRSKARVFLNPYIIEAALARLEQPLSHAEQEIVLRAVSDPGKVNWPEWWTARRTKCKPAKNAP